MAFYGMGKNLNVLFMDILFFVPLIMIGLFFGSVLEVIPINPITDSSIFTILVLISFYLFWGLFWLINLVSCFKNKMYGIGILIFLLPIISVIHYFDRLRDKLKKEKIS